ncbi:uncharacterized protein DUF3794 [Alkalibaculum bacchi]|uniref:Uncharacterized protein DUF3794 n=1 Tax=Alkalibaculum bacchi TaxID=645887 RepID=A0A366I2V2_9FIRM|nr:DUF3794 domain-containing protein [Alkalibaculum bacchi]RBP62032.1 uncharacterized protein DUF3794 [Alkalibaculum bacchi]
MPFELVREYITLDQEVNAFNTQTSLEEIIKIPDFKPNMRSILHINGEVDPSSQIIEGNVLNIEGDVNYKVYYVAEGGYLDCAEVVAPFEYSAELSDLEGDVECLIKANLEHVDYRITNSRKVNIRSIIQVEGKMIKKSNFPLLADVKEMANIQKLQDKITITVSALKDMEELSFNESVTMDEKDELSLKVIDSSFVFSEMKSSKSPSGVLITGKVNIDTLYSEDTEERKEYKNIHHSVNISQFIEKYGVENIDDFFYAPKIKSQNIDFALDPETELLSLNYDFVVSTDITFYESIEIENIQDLYSPEVKSNIEKEVIKTYCLTEDFQGDIAINDEITFETEMPVEKILLSDAQILVSSSEIADNQLKIDGVLKTSFLLSEIEMIEKVEQEIPFSYSIDIKSDEQELFDFNIAVDQLQSTLRGNSIGVESNIIVKGNFFKKIKLNLVKSVNEVEEEVVEEIGEFYSIKAHYKQPQESLWEIAKANSTTVDKLLTDNKLDGEEQVADYAPLLILK